MSHMRRIKTVAADGTEYIVLYPDHAPSDANAVADTIHHTTCGLEVSYVSKGHYCVLTNVGPVPVVAQDPNAP